MVKCMYKIARCFVFFLSMLIVSTAVFAAGENNHALVYNHEAKTQLSKKAAHLKVGMTKKQVLDLLGPATWGDKDKGIPLTLAWRNGNCNPVVVTFDKHMKVDGWDEGRVECKDSTYEDVPDVQYSCSDTNNLGICTLKMIKHKE